MTLAGSDISARFSLSHSKGFYRFLNSLAAFYFWQMTVVNGRWNWKEESSFLSFNWTVFVLFFFFTKFNWKIWQRITRVDFNLSKQKMKSICGFLWINSDRCFVISFCQKNGHMMVETFSSISPNGYGTSRLRFLMHYRETLYTFWYNFPDEEKNKNKRESWRLDCRKSIKPAKRKALFVFVPQTIYISQKENGTRFFFFFFTVSKGCANTRRQKRNFHRRRRPDSSHYVDERHYIPHSTATYTLYI
jgi:hypothetical protein